MYLIDLNGEEYPAQITYTWEAEINGKPIVTAEIEATKVNLLYLHELTEMWTLVLEDIEYKIKYLKKQGKGNKLRATIKAVPLFFDRFKALRIYDRYDRHMTAHFYFSLLFEDTEYNFVLNGTFEAQQWEGAGEGETRLKMFENGLNRYKGEFRIVGNTVYIENMIGIDSQARYEHMLNASNIVQEIDADEMYTYARGYGDYGDGEGGEDWQDAKLFREYTSPLARIPGIGIIDAPPIKNGNITTVETMDEQLRILVDESLKISVTATIHDLREQGYPIAQSGLGDRIFLIDRRIGFDEEIRVASKMIKKRWDGKVIDASYTFGTPGLVKRHQANMNAAVKNITDLLDGKLKLPFSVLDNAVAEATKALHKMQSELSIPANGGLLAIDKNNPNNVVLFNAAGLGVSTDGGATFENAITGLGVNASVVTTGTMLADRIAGGILTSLNRNTVFNMNTGELEMESAYFTLGGGARINFTSVGNRIQYRDTKDGVVRSAGFGVGKSLLDYPFAYSGTTGAADLDTLSEYYSGAIWNTTRAIAEGAANSISGGRFRYQNKATNWDKSLTIDFTESISTITPLSHGDYDFGKPNLRFRRMYVDNILGWDTVYISNPTANRGFQIGTDYSDGRNPSIRGQYPSENNYNLGEDWAPFSYTYTNTIYRNYEHEFSSHASKMNIKDIDIDLAELYVDGTDIKNFYYKNQYKENDYVNPFNLRSGVIIEQLEDSVKYLVKGDEDSVDATSIPYILQAVLKSTRKEFSQFKEETFLLIENLIKEVESLKIGA